MSKRNIDRPDGLYIEDDGKLSVHFRDQMIALTFTSTELRKIAEELAAAAIRMDLRS